MELLCFSRQKGGLGALLARAGGRGVLHMYRSAESGSGIFHTHLQSPVGSHFCFAP